MVARLILLVTVALTAARADAQVRSPVTLDANVGLGTFMTSGAYHQGSRGGPAFDVLLAVRARTVSSGRVMIGLSVNYHWPGIQDAICIQLPDGGCEATFPGFGMVAALAGWESHLATLRILGGPTYIRGDYESASLPGLQGRLDAALLSAGPVALMAYARGTYVPNYRDNAFLLLSGSLGLRLGH